LKIYGSALVMANCTALKEVLALSGRRRYSYGTYHWQRAEYVPVKLRRAPGKISADTIHGIPFRPKDQLWGWRQFVESLDLSG
jgi:hypothetical protein